MHVGWRRFRRSWVEISALGVVGTFGTAVLIALFAHVALDFSWSLSAVLGAALEGTPAHAYLLHGPAGSGKRTAARDFAAALLARGADDPDSARLRVQHGTHPDLTLIQVGGEFTPPQREQVARLGVAGAVRQVRGVSRSQIAALYRRAALVLQPSEAEGFGLPVLEALGCGAAVVASDIPPLREVGGDAVAYCPVGDVGRWTVTIGRLLDHPEGVPSRAERLARAALFSWQRHARTIAVFRHPHQLPGQPVQ